jgi:flagellin
MSSASDRYPKWFIEGMAQTAAGGYYQGNRWVQSLGINTSKTADEIETALENNKLGVDADANNYGTGYLACMYLGYLAEAKNGNTDVNATNIKNGLSSILSSLRAGKSLQDVVIDVTGKSDINAFCDAFSSEAKNFVYDLTQYVQNGSGGTVGNLTTPDDILADTPMSVALFQLDTVNDSVENKYPNDYDVLSGGTSVNSGKAGSTTPTGGTVTWGGPIPVDTQGNNNSGGNDDTGDDIGIAATKRSYGSGTSIHVGADAKMTNKIMIYIDAMDSESIGVSQVDVSTSDLATISIERVSLAIAQVSAQRSELGAYQNRLEHTIRNLENIVENTQSAESVIRDTDMAGEMVKYSNANILSQAGQAMLAQANHLKDGILDLLEPLR